jgi:hypothetical protein
MNEVGKVQKENFISERMPPGFLRMWWDVSVAHIADCKDKDCAWCWVFSALLAAVQIELEERTNAERVQPEL